MTTDEKILASEARTNGRLDRIEKDIASLRRYLLILFLAASGLGVGTPYAAKVLDVLIEQSKAGSQ